MSFTRRFHVPSCKNDKMLIVAVNPCPLRNHLMPKNRRIPRVRLHLSSSLPAPSWSHLYHAYITHLFLYAPCNASARRIDSRHKPAECRDPTRRSEVFPRQTQGPVNTTQSDLNTSRLFHHTTLFPRPTRISSYTVHTAGPPSILSYPPTKFSVHSA
jgi:hypothetical protein